MVGDFCLLYVCRCEIATREYCDFMHGYFHEEATLCSQVTHTACIADYDDDDDCC